jgi:hypothetical protein
MLLCNVSVNMLLFKSVSDEIMKSTMIFQVCCLYFKVLNSRWFGFCDFLKLGDWVTTCNLFVSREGDWTDEAIELFGDLCHVAQWQVLMSRVHSYKERKQGEREGSPVPVVELYDASGTQVCYCHSFLVPYYLFFLFFPFSSSAVFCVQLLTRLETLVFSTVSRRAFETHTASYPVDCGHSVHTGKQLGVWSWPLIST